MLSRGSGLPPATAPFACLNKTHVGPDAPHMEKCHWCERRGSLMRLFPWLFARELVARTSHQGYGLSDMFPSPTPVRVGAFSFAMS